jgi:4-hydroxybenzoate polyprenyltransferase
MPVADVSLLAGLYTWRLFLGVLVSGVALSPWLMVFSFAFFLSLSMAKRYSEIISARDIGDAKLPGRGYRKVDAPFVMAMGIAAAVSSILIFVLYLIEGAFRAAFFTTPQLLWACPVVLLLWLCRIWLICGRGELDDDPVEFAIRDRKSLVLGGIAVVVVSLSLFA